MAPKKKLLLLTIGYGQGHRSAALALQEEFLARGWEVLLWDPCESDRTGIYRLTKYYYRLCVRRAPWLWGITYAQTNTADWRSKVTRPGLRSVVRVMLDKLVEWAPDVVLCTYPIYGYMLDYLRSRAGIVVPYGMVVTDAIEISKPWVHADADWLYVPDEYSRELLTTRYSLRECNVLSTGFPVRRSYLEPTAITPPTEAHLSILYGVYLSTVETVRQIKSLLARYPHAHICMICGNRAEKMRRKLVGYIEQGQVSVIDACSDMASLFAASHLYIGKTGAATMFEAYAKGVPFIANFALPGQEQGNLELMLRDGVGVHAATSEELLGAVTSLLDNGAARWMMMRQRMLRLRHRVGGAIHIADEVEFHVVK